MGIRPCKTNLDQIKAEATLALNFFLTADSNGLPLPEDSQALRQALKHLSTLQPSSAFLKMLREGESLWPPDELLSLFALAQHSWVTHKTPRLDKECARSCILRCCRSRNLVI